MLSLYAAAPAFSAPAIAPRLAASQVSMKAPGEIGVTPPLGVYDPLNLLATPVEYPRRSYERYVELEIKHGRIAMLACLGVITTEAGIRWPGYLSKSLDLKFADIPGGALLDYIKLNTCSSTHRTCTTCTCPCTWTWTWTCTCRAAR